MLPHGVQGGLGAAAPSSTLSRSLRWMRGQSRTDRGMHSSKASPGRGGVIPCSDPKRRPDCMLVRQAEPSSAPVSAVTESALIAKAVMPARGSVKIRHCTYALLFARLLAHLTLRALQAAGGV